MTDAHSPSATDEPHAGHSHANYLAIFIALCVCTLLSVAFDLVEWNKRLTALLVLAVAVAKAQYVMRYFMHLKFEGRWKYVLLLPTGILACGMPLALAPDIGLHYYTPNTPQARVVAAGEEHGQTAHPEHKPEHSPSEPAAH